MAGKVIREENGKTYEAPSEDDWKRGVRQEVKGGGGDKSTSQLKSEMMGGSKTTGPAGSADLSDTEIEKMPDGLGKTLARQKAARRKAMASNAGS